jgi:hypothetical protein
VSWDAYFDGLDWNYTHNTTPMIYQVLEEAGVALAEREPWYQRLNGMTGREARDYLQVIVGGLEADPARFRAMNPPNGWGSYDDLLQVLREMRAAGEAACCDTRRWGASG